MKTTATLLLLISLVSRGCQGNDADNYSISSKGDTISIAELVVEWELFGHTSDSILCDAENRLSHVINELDMHDARKPTKYLKVRKAERLLERLTEKNQSRKNIDTAEMQLSDWQHLINYREEYQTLENNLHNVLKDLSNKPK
jgi:hypothetical protein